MQQRQRALAEYFKGTWNYTRVITSTKSTTEVFGNGSGIASWREMSNLPSGIQQTGVAEAKLVFMSQYVLMREKGTYMAASGMAKPIEVSKQQIWEVQSDHVEEESSVSINSTHPDQAFGFARVFFTQAPLEHLEAVDPMSEITDVFTLGEPFHPLKLRLQSSAGCEKYEVEEQRTENEHWCSPDQYDGTFDGFTADHFSSLWNVSGPAKAYAIQTHYTRLSEC